MREILGESYEALANSGNGFYDAVEEAELYAVYAASKNVPDGIWVGDAETNEFIIGMDLDGCCAFKVIGHLRAAGRQAKEKD